MKNGLLFRTYKEKRGARCQEQLIVPEGLQADILLALHDHANHPSSERTLALLRKRFYWPGMTSDTNEYCKRCERCSLRRPPAPSTRAPLVPIKTSAPLELLSVDFLKLDVSSDGYENVLVMIDHFTKLAVAVPTRDQTAVTTARVLWQQFFTKYGCPARIISDQGRNFESIVVAELCKLYGYRRAEHRHIILPETVFVKDSIVHLSTWCVPCPKRRRISGQVCYQNSHISTTTRHIPPLVIHPST
ncbi:hypothetical protein BSL78_10033 [Apostichopus japonicus]|uniref:Integrase catalytic domain-containing protein n=1 Tax=Stichopus japonicus TaxID=307972 RepID=A0A2G8KYT5_STIJA|nr:hypothetical protein BSL78_10033 [Apostichopus japonicus]